VNQLEVRAEVHQDQSVVPFLAQVAQEKGLLTEDGPVHPIRPLRAKHGIRLAEVDEGARERQRSGVTLPFARVELAPRERLERGRIRERVPHGLAPDARELTQELRAARRYLGGELGS